MYKHKWARQKKTWYLGVLSLFNMPTRTQSFQSVFNSSAPVLWAAGRRIGPPLTHHSPPIHSCSDFTTGILLNVLSCQSLTLDPCPSPTHHILLNKTYQAPSVSSLFLASEGCWAGLSRCPRCSWPGRGVGHGTRPSLASGQLRLVTSSWRQAQGSTQHQPISTILAQPPGPGRASHG